MWAFTLLPSGPQEAPEVARRSLFLVAVIEQTVDLGVVAVVFDELEGVLVVGVKDHVNKGIVQRNAVGAHVAEIALQGRVPCKVNGIVRKGDLMVSGSNGHAVANNFARAGTIIGKALQNFTGESGIIEVAVGRF